MTDGRFYEDFHVGDLVESPPHTVTAADIQQFAGARLTITGKRLSHKDPSRGIRTRRLEVVNQRGETVQSGDMPLLVRTRQA